QVSVSGYGIVYGPIVGLRAVHVPGVVQDHLVVSVEHDLGACQGRRIRRVLGLTALVVYRPAVNGQPYHQYQQEDGQPDDNGGLPLVRTMDDGRWTMDDAR